MVTIYHNPRCSKSRAALAQLRENGIQPEVVLYLDNPPDAARLKSLTEMLACSIYDLVRTTEPLYRQLGLADSALSEDAMLQVLADNPKLLQRPIVVQGNRAIVCRPAEKVLQFISDDASGR